MRRFSFLVKSRPAHAPSGKPFTSAAYEVFHGINTNSSRGLSPCRTHGRVHDRCTHNVTSGLCIAPEIDGWRAAVSVKRRGFSPTTPPQLAPPNGETHEIIDSVRALRVTYIHERRMYIKLYNTDIYVYTCQTAVCYIIPLKRSTRFDTRFVSGFTCNQVNVIVIFRWSPVEQYVSNKCKSHENNRVPKRFLNDETDK